MSWITDIFKKKTEEKSAESTELEKKETSSAVYGYANPYKSWNNITYDIYDGEKTPGELGDVQYSIPDHLKLRLRAYDMNLKTDIIKIITGKFFKWVVGSGLKLQSEIDEKTLQLLGYNINSKKIESLKSDIEALFSIYGSAKFSDYQNLSSLHKKAHEAYKTSFLGGDCLCVVRFEETGPNIQVIDGQKIEDPLDLAKKLEGNTIKHGIEINKKGHHVAFWVSTIKDFNDFEGEITHERIPAHNSLGQTVAWMIYGDKHRIDHFRGIPMISAILEKVAKLDRFVEASVSKAEQTANVVYAFEHDNDSTGENILTQSLSSRSIASEGEESEWEKSGRTANTLRQSTSSTVMNLVPGSKVVSLANPNETTFNEFFRAVFVAICASIDIPEEVALQKYEQNYSSSRAAINGWEHIVEVARKDFSDNFYKPFYRVWLEYMIYTKKINFDLFFEVDKNNDLLAKEAILNARFTGKKMPHIDPLKEAKAVRSMLGDNKTALISFEQAAENLGAGDWLQNYKKFLREREDIPDDLKEENRNAKDTDNKQRSGMESKQEV